MTPVTPPVAGVVLFYGRFLIGRDVRSVGAPVLSLLLCTVVLQR